VLLLNYEWLLAVARVVTNSGSAAACPLGPPGTIAAVPKDLASLKFITKTTLWFLEPAKKSDTVSWKVVGKGLLFDIAELKEERGTVVLQQRQRTVG
jgi:hypothetical protein